MAERILVLDTGQLWLDERALQPAEPTVDELDEQLVALIQRRAQYACREEMARRAEGLPARLLSQENTMVRRYAARLGSRGSDIAAAVLALSRSSAVIPPTTLRLPQRRRPAPMAPGPAIHPARSFDSPADAHAAPV